MSSKTNLINSNATISVVIPCYGNLSSLNRALNSVYKQLRLPNEIIVINDGGGSDSHKYIANLKNPLVPNFFIIDSIQNVGAAAARNLGWEMATGNLVAFLDSDDAWHPKKLEVQAKFMEKNSEILLSGHRHRVEKEELVDWAGYSDSSNFKLISLVKMFILNPFITPAVMIRNDAPIKFSPSQRYSEDYRLWLEYAALNYKIAVLNGELACVFKPIISSSGLSSNLIRMEVGEIQAYIAACRRKIKLLPLIFILLPYSLVKFTRRVLIRFVQFLQYRM
jgi:glycosyltransferase involved in cell wall biosynthesis